MVERKTRLRGAQVLAKSIEASDLSGVGETTGFVATVQADETIAYNAPGGGGGGSTFKQTFVTGDLTSDKITITHNLGTAHPGIVVYNNLDNIILPTESTYLTDDTIELDFTGVAPLTGTYKVRIFGTSSGTGGGITLIQDDDTDTRIETETNADEDIIRFTVLDTQEAQLDVNGLTLKTGASINEFSTDGTLSGNSDDAVPTEKAVKTYIDNEVANSALVVINQQNIVLNAFRIAINGSLTQFNMVDGIVDEYEDESGIDVPLEQPFAHMALENNTDDGSGANAVCLIHDACKYIKLAEKLNIMVEPREINMGTRYVAFCNWQGTTIASSTPSCDLNYLDKTRKDALYNLYRKFYWTFRLFMLGISQVNTVEDFFEEFIV